MKSSATLSADGRYRYALWREWGIGEGTCLFVMLNPSTADAQTDDPTIRRCINFAREWGFKRLAVGNLFARRAKNPADLAVPGDAVGPENVAWVRRLADEADLIVAAWGASGPSKLSADYRITSALTVAEAPVKCLGKTRGGFPRHPLYVRANVELKPWGMG